MSQTDLVPVTEPPLTALAQRANDAHSAFGRGSTDAVTYAIEAGTALREAKGRMAFGEWLPWLAQHLEFSERTAQLYMQLAAHPPAADPQRVADLSLRAAAKALATPRAAARQPAAVIATGRELAAGERAPAGERAQAAAAGGARPNTDRVSRVRGVLKAIDSVLERAESGELSDAAAAELLREAASGARAAASELEAFAAELSGPIPAPRSTCPRPADM